MRLAMILASSILISGCLAAPGYHYETGSFVPTPNDPCWRGELGSAGALRAVNASLGKPNGVPDAVQAILGLRSAVQATQAGNSISCHATLVFANGKTDSGILTFTDPGEGQPLSVWWATDRPSPTVTTRIPPEHPQNPNVKIEKDAILYDRSKGSLDLIDFLARLVVASGYECDSVSAARPMILSRGYVLVCNNFAYDYDIQDKGGHWMVVAE